MKYLNFLSGKKTEKNMKESFLRNMGKKNQIFNEHLEFDKNKEIFEINFSTYFHKKRKDVHIEIKGLINMEILTRSPFQYGYSCYKKKLKRIFLSSLNETLPYC
jgi:hypothetical protein